MTDPAPDQPATDDPSTDVGREVFRDLPWPFAQGRFPDHLGAVVQRTVLTGEQPPRLVVHDADNSWLVGDGRGDPNLPGACVVTHISHVVEVSSSVRSLVDLPPGWSAERVDPHHPWVRSPHEYPPE